jgi:hypothetical protein
MRERPVFVDTGYFVALLAQRDALHASAMKLAREWKESGRSLLTTDAVIIELANFFARGPLRRRAISAIAQIRGAVGWTIERVTPDRLRRAESLYASHLDKSWSLTDCLSIETMREHRATEAATPDHHFAQAGFRVLMSD